MTREQLKDRTRQFALDVVDALMTLSRDDFVEVVRPQLLRAGTGVATNYRATCRSRSGKEFASRLATVVEEVDESELWLDFLQTRRYGAASIIAQMRTEAVQLRAILSKSRATTLRRLRERRKARQISQSLNPPISK
jgi:four helix bundle protein